MSVSRTGSSGFFKSLLLLALAPIGLAFSSPSEAATTYYVRADGGDAAQCTGRSDAPYPGSGTNQACAWKSLYYALPTSGSPRIAGGDTVIVGPGNYQIGWGAPGAAGGRCYSGGPYDCYLPPIPSGPSATAKTRILGKGHDSGCAAPPRLWGTERVSSIINLNGSSNVEIGCMEITDQSDCVYGHSNSGAACSTSQPYGAWAMRGVEASNSQNVWLHDVNIHGMAHSGIRAGGLTNWKLEHVKVNANGWVGWDGDIGSASSNSGDIVLRDVEIAWNGCGERWQTGAPWACWAQQGGGYGDGLGTAKTGGKWLIEDSFIHHNTSDGLDLLYMDGAAGSSVTVRRTYAVGNAGNQLKTRGATLIENSVVVGNCAYFSGKDYMLAGDQCRAQGNSISVSLSDGQTTTIRHNTITGQGDCLILSDGGTSSSKLYIQNNALVGGNDYTGDSGELTCGHYATSNTSPVSYTGNAFYNVKSGQCPSGNLCGQNPKLANMSLASFDATPVSGSPLIDKAPNLGVNGDFLMQARPSGNGPDIGAYEFQVGGGTPAPTPDPTPDPTPAPTCTRNAPSFSMSGPTAAVAAGTTVKYTVSLRNNDSSECGSTGFNLARTAPSGWNASLSSTSVTLNPGASTSVTLSVTSSGSATAGNYGIGSGVSSGAGAIHTANASATYAVAKPQTTPEPTPAPAPLTETLGTNKTSYRLGERVYMTARVLRDGKPVKGASVHFVVTKPNEHDLVFDAVTDSNGYARDSFRLRRNRRADGTYELTARATSGSASATARSTFTAR